MTSHHDSSKESLRLRTLIQEIGLPLRRLPEILEEKPEACLSWWGHSNDEIKISHVHFERMANLVGIREENLFQGSYDQGLARKRLYGGHQILPERYTLNQNSFLRTSSHIFRYVVLTRGQSFADELLTNLNISPLAYQEPDTKINLTYFADLLEALSNNGFRPSEMDTLASVIFLSLQETSLGSKFQTAEDTFDVYKILADNFHQFDSNFEYKNKFVGKKYIVKTLLPLEHHPNLKDQPQKIQRLMRYRHILSAWFPYLAGLTPLFPRAEIIRSSSSILEMEYQFDLSNTKRPSPLQLL